jgi:hypothetical protein
MSTTDSGLSGFAWRKASCSACNGECIEVARTSGRVMVRDSKDPEGPVLNYSAEAFQAFLGEAKRAASSR